MEEIPDLDGQNIIPVGSRVVQHDSTSCNFYLPEGCYLEYTDASGKLCKTTEVGYRIESIDGAGCSIFNMGTMLGFQHGADRKGRCQDKFVLLQGEIKEGTSFKLVDTRKESGQ